MSTQFRSCSGKLDANEPVIELKHWSDLAYLAWRKETQQRRLPMDILSDVFRHQITEGIRSIN